MDKRLTMAAEQESETVSPPTVADYPIIIACEVGGGFQIGWHDTAASGPFESRAFAQAVATSTTSRGLHSMRADVEIEKGGDVCASRLLEQATIQTPKEIWRC
jgi:hypothetical protein